MNSMTRMSSGRIAGIYAFALLVFSSCSPGYDPANHGVKNDENSQELPQPVATPEPPSTPFVGKPIWSMESPADGITSSDFTPKIKGSGFGSDSGRTAVVYLDKSCSNEVGRARIQNGEFEISSIALSDEGKDDGSIRFYARVNSGSRTGACTDLALGYDLRTDLPGSAARYFRLMAIDNAATTAVIGFHASNTDLSDHKLHYGTEDHGRDADSYPNVAKPAVIHAYNQMNNAFVRLKGLKPETAYYFVVTDPSGVSARYWFKTASESVDKPLSIVAGGDSRNNQKPRQNANIMVSKLRPDFVMFAGDMTGGGSAREWREWFEDWQLTISKDGRLTPIVVVRGNHESSNEMIEKFFDTPKGVYYATSFGGELLRVYNLNSESGVSGAQTDWLRNDLSKNPQFVWKFAQYHRPMRPHTRGKSDATSVYNAWAGVFHKYKVDLVQECDAHVVKSTWPVRPSSSGGSDEGFVRDDEEGTVYIGEGGWGAPLRANNDDKAWTRNSGRFNHVVWIHLDKSRASIRFVKTENVSSVAALTEQNRFSLPSKLDVWNPSNGAVLTLQSRK